MCFVEVDIDEISKFQKIKIVKAKKEYGCCECSDQINIGDQYEYVVGKDFEFYQYKTCMSCKEIKNLFCCSYYYTRMWEDVIESIREGDINIGCIELLSEKARNKFIDFYDEYVYDY